ncbi:MAG: exonuclease SbcCD subunit D [Lachnospiraceae bacterium]|nr:exonuclease SbcCD subunit D [Lachnospiraceae bacterium]
MRFMHLSDLHLGKVVGGFSMLEDQAHMLKQIVEYAQKEQVDAVVVAGDVYDRSVPPAQAVQLLDAFLSALIEKKIRVLLIAGNHDSAERLSFAGEILEKQGLTIAGKAQSPLKKVTFQDPYGEVTFFLLPFVKPLAENTQQLVDQLLAGEEIDRAKRNVCVAHLFVTASGSEPERSDSESCLYVGGLDNVDASSFSAFDYTALGHIHKSQRMGQGNVIYGGSLLKYSFSEVLQDKRVPVVELKEKGNIEIDWVKFAPLHDMRKIRGRLEELLREDVIALADPMDYLCVELTNEEELIDPMGQLRSVYPNVMQMILQKNQNRELEYSRVHVQEQKKSLPELYEEFFEDVTGRELDENRRQVVLDVAGKAGGVEE